MAAHSLPDSFLAKTVLRKMALEKLLASYHCQHALQLCQQARMLRNEQRYQEAAKICSFVSTLCIKSEHESCKLEAKLCASSAKHLECGSYSQAKKACDEARRICCKNNEVRGS